MVKSSKLLSLRLYTFYFLELLRDLLVKACLWPLLLRLSNYLWTAWISSCVVFTLLFSGFSLFYPTKALSLFYFLSCFLWSLSWPLSLELLWPFLISSYFYWLCLSSILCLLGFWISVASTNTFIISPKHSSTEYLESTS